MLLFRVVVIVVVVVVVVAVIVACFQIAVRGFLFYFCCWKRLCVDALPGPKYVSLVSTFWCWEQVFRTEVDLALSC